MEFQEADKDYKSTCTFVSNTTALKGIFQRLATQFGAMYKRKAFLHWYKGEGMDEMEFQEADKNVRDLITEFQDKQDAVVVAEDEEIFSPKARDGLNSPTSMHSGTYRRL